MFFLKRQDAKTLRVLCVCLFLVGKSGRLGVLAVVDFFKACGAFFFVIPAKAGNQWTVGNVLLGFSGFPPSRE